MITTRKLRLDRGGVTLTPRPDGSSIMKATQPLAEFPVRITDRLVHWASVAPERTFLAMRPSPGADWRRLSYAQTLELTQRVASALLARGLSAERPIAILSDNDLEHALLALGAMYAGISYAPISSAYSLVANDFAKLRHVMGVLTPGLVFASDGKRFGRALREVVPAGTEVVVTHDAPADRPCTSFEALLATPIDPALRAANAAVGPDTIAKFLFSSGSTGLPKGVINTQRMLCSNQQMILQALPFIADKTPVILDWLPWNHTFGGNHNFGIVLFHGGTLYIDDGKPVPGLFERSLQNLREIAPTAYFNVPKGFELLVPALRADKALARHFFSELQMMMFAGAGLSQHLWDSLDEIAVDTCGERIAMISGLGCTETAPSATFASAPSSRAGLIGLPVSGVELKLVPTGRKTEMRVRGPSVTPGYWRAPELTAKSFDSEGYFQMGDAVRLVDEHDPNKGLLFDGRITEDFKLTTGTWVSVGPLRTHIVLHCAPLARDVVLAGRDRNDIAALIFPDLASCRMLAADLPASATPAEVLAHPAVRARFQVLLDELAANSTGSATRVARAMLMEEMATVNTGEATDKGSLNCAAVVDRRANLVEELYAPVPTARVLLPRPRKTADVA